MPMVATGSDDVGTSQNMLIYVKRLANKTLIATVPQKG